MLEPSPSPHEQPKKVRLCDCGEPAVVGVKKYDPWKYMEQDYIPTLRGRLLLCVRCWCEWEDKHRYRKFASAVGIG